MPRLGRVLRQTAFVVVLQLITFLVLDRLLVGFAISSVESALALALAVVAGNIFVRPLILLLTLPLTIVSLGLWSLVLNAGVIFAATALVPGGMADGFATALVLATAFALVNTLATALSLIQDEDTFYYYFANRVTARSEEHELVGSGLLVIEIDGLAEPILREAIGSGRMPNLRRWLLSDQFELHPWWCHLPTQTSSAQAGILYGNDRDIPGFRWYDKRARRLIESSSLEAAAEIAAARVHSAALLSGGASISNLLDGGAKLRFATASAVRSDANVQKPARDLFLFFYDPYSFFRTLVLMLYELVVSFAFELARLRTGSAHIKFPFTRAVSTVLLAEVSTFFATRELFDATPAIYLTFVGYDVVAHYRGPRSRDAMRTLRTLDTQISRLRRVAQLAPREYSVVVLSDHGQSAATPFNALYGSTLEQLVASAARAQPIWMALDDSELMGHFSSLLTGPAESGGAGGRTARSLLERVRQRQARLGARSEETPTDQTEAVVGEIVVCPSGNLANVYFSAHPEPVTASDIAREYPALIPTLVNHPGIGFVVARSATGGALVSARGGVLDLDSGDVVGRDPLEGYPSELAGSIRRLIGFANAGDLIINGAILPDGKVCGFENQVSVHGGAGGEQAHPFVIAPTPFHLGLEPIIGAESVYKILVKHRPPLPAPDG